jgi:hypothetical protein
VDLLRSAIQVDPELLDFGAVHYGECPAKELLAINGGDADLRVLGIDFGTGTNPDPGKPRFTKVVSQNIPATLKPEEYLTVTVTYCQDDAQADTGELQVSSDDPKAPIVKVPMVSNYKGDPEFQIVKYAPPDPPEQLWPKVGVSQYTVDLGNIDPGKNATVEATIMNASTGDAILSLTNPLLTKISSGANVFSHKFTDPLNAGAEVTPPIYLNPGDVVSAAITYSCSEMNFDDKGNLTITTNDGDINDDNTADDGKAILFLKARCGYVGPKIEVSRTLVDFGDVQITTTKTEKVTIANSGKDNLVISEAKLQDSGTDFTFSPDPLPTVINAGGNVELSLTYAPNDQADLGAASNAFLIASNDGFNNTNIKIDLKARATDPTISVNPQSISFGNVFVGVQTPPTKVSVQNAGIGPLSISLVALTAGSSTDFVLGTLPAFPVVLQTNDKLEFDVSFAPTAVTDRQGAVSIKNSDVKSSGEVLMPLTGTGLECCPAKAHAIGVCNGVGCDYTCEPSYWDTNNDLQQLVSNGCDYGPCSTTNGGIEVCDGVDNDCNGTKDDGQIDLMCPPQPHTTFACDSIAKTCKVASCEQTWFNVNGTVADGCECQQDTNDQQGKGNACDAAQDLGSFFDTEKRTVTGAGNLVGQNDEDWFTFEAKDNPAGDNGAGTDNWYTKVVMTVNPNNAFTFTVLQDSCSAPTESCINGGAGSPANVYEKKMDFADWAGGKLGEAPCTGVDAAGSIDGRNFCHNDTHRYYVRVSRAGGAPYTCDSYQITVTIGR